MRALPHCVQGCQAQQQAYAEYSLMAPYLGDKTVFNEPDIAASRECNALPGTEFELWFMRHALSCNNATPGWRQRPLLKEFDPGLNVTMYPGFKTHNSERGAACSGPLGHRSRIYMDPSRGQTERARAEVKRGERQLLSRRGAWAALKRMTRRGG